MKHMYNANVQICYCKYFKEKYSSFKITYKNKNSPESETQS